MTRTILIALAAAGLVGVLSATGCQSSGVGDPCVPDSEYAEQGGTNPNYFSATEASAESGSYQCQTRLCLVNHFQGRVSCPFGQSDTNAATPAASGQACANLAPTDPAYCGACVEPGSSTPVTGVVPPQCLSRTADQAVYCSCRCSDENGKTDNGNFCSCPDGFVCSSPDLIVRIGAADTGLAGGFCIKQNTAYVAGVTDCSTTSANLCDPTKNSDVCHQ